MEKIAITGNIACGKSTAFDVIKNAGFPIIDCDDIVKDLYKKDFIISGVKGIFPEVVLNNTIELRILKDVIFSEKNNKKVFEDFLYPNVVKEFMNFFEKSKSKNFVFVVVPLLFEAGFEKYFDKILLISADEDVRKSRLINRNTLLSDSADIVIKSQMTEKEKIKKSDYIIENNGTLEEFKKEIEKFLMKNVKDYK